MSVHGCPTCECVPVADSTSEARTAAQSVETTVDAPVALAWQCAHCKMQWPEPPVPPSVSPDYRVGKCPSCERVSAFKQVTARPPKVSATRQQKEQG